MPPFLLPDGKEISLDSNLPLGELPTELQQRLGEVLAELRAFLKGRTNFPDKGTILADEDGNRMMARTLDVDEFALVYLVNGSFEKIRKDGKLGAHMPVRSEPWSGDKEPDVFANNKVDGRKYRILGKYVDYDRD